MCIPAINSRYVYDYSAAGASSAVASAFSASAAAASSAFLAASAAAISAFFFATNSAFAAFFAFSSSKRLLSACFLSFDNCSFLAFNCASLFFFHSSKRRFASSSVKAPFLTPPSKCFFKSTPSLERRRRTVSVGCAPTLTQYKALSKFKLIVAGLVFGL